MATIQSINLIATDPNIRSGRPCIAGTGIEVTTVVIQHLINQMSPVEFATDYGVSMAQVHAALAYYYIHKAEIDASMEERDRVGEEYRKKALGIRPPILR